MVSYRESCIALTVFRWTGRLLSLGVLAIVAAFFVGDSGLNPLKLTLPESMLMLSFCVALVGLMVAWRWEFIGSAVTIAGLLLFYVAHWIFSGHLPRGWAFGVMAIPALVFLGCAA